MECIECGSQNVIDQDCPNCGGTGNSSEYNQTCAECNGRGILPGEYVCLDCHAMYGEGSDDQEIRAAVVQFAEAMEDRLKEKDVEKGTEGWVDCDNYFLLQNLTDKVDVLNESLIFDDKGSAQVECVDIANYAMMLFDKLCRK